MNTVTVVGNLTRDPELRFTPSGTPTASIGIAINRTWTDQQTKERKEQTSFVDVSCWSSLAENVANSLHKGDRVLIYGRLEQDTWTDQQTQTPRSKIKIVAEEVSPSLRWATAQVARNAREQGGGTPVANQPPDGYTPPPNGGTYLPGPAAGVGAAPAGDGISDW